MNPIVDRSNLKVLLLTDSDGFAGTERHILDLAKGLRAQGVNIAVACPEPSLLSEGLKREGLPHVVMQKGGPYDRAAIHRLRDLLASGKFDILHSHNGRTALIAALAVRSARRGFLVTTQHFISPNHTSHRGFKKIVSGAIHRWIDRHTHAQVAISQSVRQAMLARNRAHGSRIHLVPNGLVDPSLESLRNAAEIREELGLHSSALLLVCAARLEAEKNIGDLVEAMMIVSPMIPAVVCVIIGEGSQRTALENLVRERRLQEVVKLPGFRADALSIIHAADVFVLPSTQEPFGLVLLEAMALGKPVVAVRAGGPVEIVVENETGLLVPPSQPQALAEALIRLLRDTTERESMGKKGRERFESHYTESRMAREMIEVYSSLRSS